MSDVPGNRHWGMYKEGDAVLHITTGRNAHVVAAPSKSVLAGYAPVKYDDAFPCYKNVPIDDLSRR